MGEVDYRMVQAVLSVEYGSEAPNIPDDDPRVEKANRVVKAIMAELGIRKEMEKGCIQMITEELMKIVGEAKMKHVPPMFYPEVIHNINALKLQALESRDAWKSFAKHQELCGVCAESVRDCEIGSHLQLVALKTDTDIS